MKTAIADIATATRTELRHIAASYTAGKCPASIRDSRAKLRAYIIECREFEAKIQAEIEAANEDVELDCEDWTVEQKLEHLVAVYGETIPLSALEDLGFGKTARTYSWYWNSHKYGKKNPGRAAAEALGFKATIRKVDGERALVLTPAS